MTQPSKTSRASSTICLHIRRVVGFGHDVHQRQPLDARRGGNFAGAAGRGARGVDVGPPVARGVDLHGHVDQGVRAARELDDLRQWARVPRDHDRSALGVEPVGQRREIGLGVQRMPHANRPSVGGDGVSHFELSDRKARALAGHLSAAVAVGLQAHGVVGARDEIGTKGAVMAEQALGHALQRPRPVDIEVITRSGALVPPRQREVRVVGGVVEVQVG